MIIDCLDQFAQYVKLNKHFATAFAVLNRANLAPLNEGRMEVDGLDVFAEVIRGQGKKPGEAPLETHDQYIDIHYVLDGTDLVGWKARKDMVQPRPKEDPNADVIFYDDEPDAWVQLKPGQFAICFPEDGHVPMISFGEIHKVVVKVKVD